MTTPRRKRPPYQIDVHRASRRVTLSAVEIRRAVTAVLEDEGVAAAELSVAIVDDAAIHVVNREHLEHDCPTDVISFLFDGQSGEGAAVIRGRRGAGLAIDGELVVSDETAEREARRHQWSPSEELTLYLVHGTLHLCGYDDTTPAEKRMMRRREREILQRLRSQ